MSEVTVYGLHDCDTCRKVRRWLDGQGMAHRFVDVRREGVAPERIAGWAARAGAEILVNRRGRTWRQLPEAERAREGTDLHALLAEQPALIKRPVIETADGAVHVGWNEAVRAALASA